MAVCKDSALKSLIPLSTSLFPSRSGGAEGSHVSQGVPGRCVMAAEVGGFEQGRSLSHRNCDADGPGWDSPQELRKVSRALCGSSSLATVSLSPQGKCRVQPRAVESTCCCQQQGLPGPQDLMSLPNRFRRQGQFTPKGKTPSLLRTCVSDPKRQFLPSWSFQCSQGLHWSCGSPQRAPTRVCQAPVPSSGGSGYTPSVTGF